MSPTSCRCSTPRRHSTLAEIGPPVKARPMLDPMRPYAPDSPWDLDPATTFITHGTYGACPRPVLDFQQALVAELEANPLRFLTRELEDRRDAARESVAAFLGADP